MTNFKKIFTLIIMVLTTGFFFCPVVNPAAPYVGGSDDGWDFDSLGSGFYLGGAEGVSISSEANQTFDIGQASTPISPITVTDATGLLITVADDIRIHIPASFPMTWDSGDTSAVITGTASGKVSPTVSFEPGNKILVIDVTAPFGVGEFITVSGLNFNNFSGLEMEISDNLELDANNDAGADAFDDKTVTIIKIGQYCGGSDDGWDLNSSSDTYLGGISAVTISSAANQIFDQGQVSASISAITITTLASGLVTVADDIRIRIPAGFPMTWDSADDSVIITGTASGKVTTTTVGFESGDKILLIYVKSPFISGDSITVSGLNFNNFIGFGQDNLELDIDNDAGIDGVDAKNITIRQADQYCGGIDDGWDFDPSPNLYLGGGAAITLASETDQTFNQGQVSAPISPITITAFSPGLVTAADDIRIRIPAGFPMTWDSADDSAVITGTASGKVLTDVSFEPGNKILVIDVISPFISGDSITVSGLNFNNFTGYGQDNLELDVDNDAGIDGIDEKIITIRQVNQYCGGSGDGWDLNESASGVIDSFLTPGHNPVDHFALETQPSVINPGETFTLYIQGRDSSGNPTDNLGDSVVLEINTGTITYSPVPIPESEFDNPNDIISKKAVVENILISDMSVGRRVITARLQGTPSVSGTTVLEVGLAINSNTTWTEDKDYSDYAVLIANNATLTFNCVANGGMITLSCRNLIIDKGATINANGYGSAGGSGTGQGTAGTTGGGGGYGGVGGNSSDGMPGGITYGSTKEPTDLGSGGGSGSGGSGGAGGGAIKLLVSNQLTHNGIVTVKGNAGGTNAGGGSGGSLWIVAKRITGLGWINVSGGAGYASNGGGGGGGRISVWCPTKLPLPSRTPRNEPFPKMYINFWYILSGGTGANAGGDGTLYFKRYRGAAVTME
jgi:hemolysin-activating ACP:hemolysin acyltransferase